MPEAMATLAQATSIPIATGEQLCTKYEFARVLQCGAVEVLQPNLGRTGGILEAKKLPRLPGPIMLRLRIISIVGPLLLQLISSLQYPCLIF